MKIQFQSTLDEATPLPIHRRSPGQKSEPARATAPGTAFQPAQARRILAAIDFSAASRALLRKAAALARETQARLTMIYVQPQDWIEEDASNPLVADAYRDLGEEAIARLNRLAEEVVEGDLELESEFRVGRWVRTLIETARRERTDLIVVAGEERRGLLGLLRAQPTERLVRESPCPVVVLPERILMKNSQTPPAVRQMVVAAGLTESSRRAVKHAANLALQLNLRLVLLHAMPDRGLGTRLDIGHSLKLQKEACENVRKKMLDWLAPEIAAGLEAKVLVRTGFPVTRVLERHLTLLNPEMVVLGASFGSRFGGKYVRAALRSTSAPVVFVGPECPPEPRPNCSPAPAAVAQRVSPAKITAPHPHKRILVVDDDPSVRESLDELFRGENCDVTLAADGQDVVGKVDPTNFDLVLLDLKMRGKNGWATLRHLHALNPRLPVVLITGLPDRYKLAASAGVDALVEKPLDVPALLETVHGLLENPDDAPPPSAARRGSCRHILSSSENLRRKLSEQYLTPYPAR